MQELLPIRYARMASSPFAFFRGTAAIMAADLGGTPRSGLTAQLGGDAHLSNFGGFASPDRRVVFDLNDFDETLPGPWEWDVKRLAASLAVAGRANGLGASRRGALVAGAVGSYRTVMGELAEMRNLDVWYERIDEDTIVAALRDAASKSAARSVERAVDKARTKDSMRALGKLTRQVNGELRLVSDPPLIVPISELVPTVQAGEMERAMRALLGNYARSLSSDMSELVESYRFVDLAHKVVGVGSVGARAWIVLLTGRDAGDPLFLQVKEAQPSVLQEHLGRGRYANQGRRVVEGQRLMQATGDILLGWLRTTGLDGATRDFYVRQLWDWKLSATIETMGRQGLEAYARLCGHTLARAHARTGDRIAIAAYLGADDAFDRALVEFGEAYADQNERDHQALLEAIRSGRVPAQPGV